MSMPTILPSGQLHPDLFNGPFVKHISSTPAATGEPGAKVHGDTTAEKGNKIWLEDQDSVIDLSGHFSSKRVYS